MDDATNEPDSGQSKSVRRPKIERVIDQRGLDGLERELENHWTAPPDDRYSLRELADLFNRRVLRSALEEAGQNPLEGEAENFYTLLTDDDVTSGMRLQAERRLEGADIDIDRLESDFVSHQTVYTYLTDHRNVEPPSSKQSESPEKGLDRIQRLTSRLRAVTQTTLESLQKNTDFSLGDARVFVNVSVMCRDCGSEYWVDDLLDGDGCECE